MGYMGTGMGRRMGELARQIIARRRHKRLRMEMGRIVDDAGGGMYEPQMLTVWKITGEECSETGGGVATCYAITGGDTQIPKPQAILDHYSNSDHWCVIHAIERVGVIPAGSGRSMARVLSAYLGRFSSTHADQSERIVPEA